MRPTTLYCLLGLVLIVPDGVAGAMFQETCSVDNTCISGYACDIVRQMCLATPGQQCDTTTDCVKEASCSEGTCYCDSGYRPYLSGLCESNYGTRLLGEPCSDKRPCNGEVMACADTIGCYTCDRVTDRCATKASSSCLTSTECVSHSTCDTLEGCVCDSGYTRNEAGLCGASAGGSSGDYCSSQTPCLSGYVCIEHTCYADGGVACSDSQQCANEKICDSEQKKCSTKAGYFCLISTECVSHSTCDTLEGCVCDSGYTANEAGLCGNSDGGSSGDYCSNQTPCLSGYVCIENTCYADVGVACSDSQQCANGTCDSEQKKCLLPQYYRCQTSASCVSHATCASHGHCMCNTGYTPNRIGLCEGNQVANPTTSPTSVENSTQAVGNSTQAVGNSTQAVANSTHAVGNSTQAVENSTHAVETSTHAVETSTHAVETSSHAVETSSHAVETSSHAVETSSHAVETSSHAVETSTHAVETSSHAVETSSHAVETSTRLVEGSTTISNTCSGQRNKGLRLTMVWIPNGLSLMTAFLLVGL